MTQSPKKLILNAGSGSQMSGQLPAIFAPDAWAETRLDIVAANQPDIVGSFSDMRGTVADGAFDVVYSSHAIEHLYAHEVIPAFQEFRRVLKPGGFALVTCPSLIAISRLILQEGAEAVAYQSPAGPIRPIDMLFGHSEAIAVGALAMSHNTAFTAPRLGRVAMVSGFTEVRVMEGQCFDIWGLLLTPETPRDTLASLFSGSMFEEFLRMAQAVAPQATTLDLATPQQV